MMKKIIHINQHIIRSNSKNNTNDPVITCKTYKSNEYANSLDIKDKNNITIAKVIYSPDKPLSCGAKVWIETESTVVLNNE
tara:strand:- start:67 stop:309 length:243 start_codon:yes stop_codon:yes gene_type:complete